MKTIKQWKTGRYKGYRITKVKNGYSVFQGRKSICYYWLKTQEEAMQYLSNCINALN
jgi:viroplasmin and RNaseH domain-containing protein